MRKSQKYKHQDHQNPYIWCMSLPSPLKKFANRAKILMGNELKQDIIDTKFRRQAELIEEINTVDKLQKVVDYNKHNARTDTNDTQLEIATIRILEKNLEAAQNQVLETRCDIVECIQAMQQYEEIEKEDGEVRPVVNQNKRNSRDTSINKVVQTLQKTKPV